MTTGVMGDTQIFGTNGFLGEFRGVYDTANCDSVLREQVAYQSMYKSRTQKCQNHKGSVKYCIRASLEIHACPCCTELGAEDSWGQ